MTDLDRIIAEMREFAPALRPMGRAMVERFADRLAALAGAAPDWVMVPRKLTAENGAKALLSCEFYETVRMACPECSEGYVDDEVCESCDGAGEFSLRVAVEWDTIKRIHDMVVANLAAPHAPAKAREDVKLQLDRLESCAKEVGWHNAMKARSSGPMSAQDFRAYDGAHRGIAGARKAITAALATFAEDRAE